MLKKSSIVLVQVIKIISNHVMIKPNIWKQKNKHDEIMKFFLGFFSVYNNAIRNFNQNYHNNLITLRLLNNLGLRN